MLIRQRRVATESLAGDQAIQPKPAIDSAVVKHDLEGRGLDVAAHRCKRSGVNGVPGDRTHIVFHDGIEGGQYLWADAKARQEPDGLHISFRSKPTTEPRPGCGLMQVKTRYGDEPRSLLY